MQMAPSGRVDRVPGGREEQRQGDSHPAGRGSSFDPEKHGTGSYHYQESAGPAGRQSEGKRKGVLRGKLSGEKALKQGRNRGPIGKVRESRVGAENSPARKHTRKTARNTGRRGKNSGSAEKKRPMAIRGAPSRRKKIAGSGRKLIKKEKRELRAVENERECRFSLYTTKTGRRGERGEEETEAAQIWRERDAG